MDRYDKDSFIPVKWKEVKEGDIIYLLGTHLGRFRAYGPHKVVNQDKMILVNNLGDKFLQYQETLGKLKEKEPC